MEKSFFHKWEIVLKMGKNGFILPLEVIMLLNSGEKLYILIFHRKRQGKRCVE
jgi:hypothetical protein